MPVFSHFEVLRLNKNPGQISDRISPCFILKIIHYIYNSMNEIFILQSSEVDSLGACSYGTLRSVDLLPRLANYLSIALDTVEVRFENAGQALKDFEQGFVAEYRHIVADAVEFHELNADEYGSAYPDSAEMDAQEIIVSLFDALDQLSPDGQYFGSHPGDGSDFGYWENEF